MVGAIWADELPKTRERLDEFEQWLVNVYQCDTQMTERHLENLIKEKNNGKVPNIRKPNEYNRYYACDLPRVNGKQKKIQKATRLEVLKGIYLFFYGTECKEKKKPTFEEAYKEWTEFRRTQIATRDEGGISSLTVYRQETDYIRFFSDSEIKKRRIDKITTAELYDEFQNIIRKKGLSKKAFKNLIGYVNNTFERAIDTGSITQNPVKRLDKTMLLRKCKEEKIYNDEERILNDIELYKIRKILLQDESEHPRKPVNYAIELSLYTGLRVSELVALKYSDIENGMLKVERSEHEERTTGKSYVYYLGDTKNHKHRKLPLTTEAQDVINRLRLATQGEEDDFLFRDEKTGQRITAKVVRSAVTRRGNKADIPNVSIHRIRRTFESVLISKGIPLNVTADWLGHLPEVSIENYMYNQWTEEQQKERIYKAFSHDDNKENVM